MSDSISDSLMAMTLKMQDADNETRLLFGQLFEAARKMAEKGMSPQEIQMIVMLGYQVSQNPEMRQMYQYLFKLTKFDPNDTFH